LRARAVGDGPALLAALILTAQAQVLGQPRALFSPTPFFAGAEQRPGRLMKKDICHGERSEHLLFLVEKKQKQIPQFLESYY
jgi:hypothetical protein